VILTCQMFSLQVTGLEVGLLASFRVDLGFSPKFWLYFRLRVKHILYVSLRISVLSLPMFRKHLDWEIS